MNQSIYNESSYNELVDDLLDLQSRYNKLIKIVPEVSLKISNNYLGVEKLPIYVGDGSKCSDLLFTGNNYSLCSNYYEFDQESSHNRSCTMVYYDYNYFKCGTKGFPTQLGGKWQTLPPYISTEDANILSPSQKIKPDITCSSEVSKNVVCWGVGLGCNNLNMPWRYIESTSLYQSCSDMSTILYTNNSVNIDNTLMGNVGKTYINEAFKEAPYTLKTTEKSVITFNNTSIISNNISNGLFIINNPYNQYKPITISGLTISDISFEKPLITIYSAYDVIINNLNVTNCTFLNSSIFKINSNRKLKLININISDCNITGSNSVIQYNNTLSIVENNIFLTNINITSVNSNSHIIELTNNMTVNMTVNMTGNISDCSCNGAILYIDNKSSNIDLSNNNMLFSKNNTNDGVIKTTSNTYLYDASMIFTKNTSNTSNSNGIINNFKMLKIYGNNTNLQFLDNSNISTSIGGGAIKTKNLIIEGIKNKSIDFCGNNASGGGAIASEFVTIIDSSITFRNNRAKNNRGGAINVIDISFINSTLYFNGNIAAEYGGAINSTNVTFYGGNYNYSNNIIDKVDIGRGAAIAAHKILIDNSSFITNLSFIDNSGFNVLDVSSFDTSLACPNTIARGCSNIYNFRNNNTTSYYNQYYGGLVVFNNRFFIAGGTWDFSNNKHDNNSVTFFNSLTSRPLGSGVLGIRYADISFDISLVLSPTTTIIDVSKSLISYYQYRLDRRTIWWPPPADQILANAHKILPHI